MTWIISIEYLEDYTQGLNNRVKIDIVCKLFPESVKLNIFLC